MLKGIQRHFILYYIYIYNLRITTQGVFGTLNQNPPCIKLCFPKSIFQGQPPGMYPKPCNNEISTTPLNWLYRRIFEPSTVCGITNLQAFNPLISRATPVCTEDMRNIASPILRCTECRSNDDNLLPLLRQKTPTGVTGGYQKMGKSTWSYAVIEANQLQQIWVNMSFFLIIGEDYSLF